MSGSRSLAVVLTAVMLCLAPVSCRRATTEVIVKRLIPRHAERAFNLAMVGSPHPTASWKLGCDGVRVVASHDLRVVDPCVNGGALAQATGPDPWFALDVDLDADGVDTLELEGTNLDDATIEVYWSASRTESTPQNRAVAVGAEHTTVVQVAESPSWRGRVQRLRVDLGAKAGRRFNLRRLTAVDHEVDSSALKAAVAEAWRVDLGHEVREAVLAPPGAVHRLEVGDPDGASLRFGCGLQRGVRVPVRFEVVAKTGEGEPRLIWSRAIVPKEAGRWSDVVVPLGQLVGRAVTLELVTATDGPRPLDAARGLPLWADPTVVAPGRVPERPNVILVSVDTLRADHVSAYGYKRSTTPNLDRWAAQNAVVFENAVASAPWTLPSHAAMFSGRDAVENGVNLDDPVPTGFELLAEALRDAGYRTVAFTGGAFLNPRYGLDQGVERYDYWPSAVDDADELSDHVDGLVRWLENDRVEPFFALLHTYEVHGPYRPRQPYFGRLAAPGEQGFDGVVEEDNVPPVEAEGWVRRSWIAERERADATPRPLEPSQVRLAVDTYDAGVAYTDAQLERLLGALTTTGLDRRTVVVITSDHGEALGEKGLGGHLYLEDFNLMVPLMVALPGGVGGGTRVAHQVRSVDVAPTILAAAGLPPLPAADGTSLLPLLNGGSGEVPDEAWSYAASSNRGLSLRVANRLKYIFNDTVFTPVRGAEQLYDLATDPGETVNRAASSPRVAALRKLARAELAGGGVGWEIEVANASSRELVARVSTDWLTPFGVKSGDLPCDCIDPVGPGTFDLRAPVGTSYTLFLPTLLRRPLRVRGRAAGARGVQFDLQVAGADAGSVLRESFDGQVWTAGEGEPAATSGLTVRWRGPLPGEGVSAQPEDPALKQQLKALGYIQ